MLTSILACGLLILDALVLTKCRVIALLQLDVLSDREADTMRVQAFAPRNVKRPRFTAAYHAPNSVRRVAQSGNVLNEIVSQDEAVESGTSVNHAKPSLQDMKTYLRHYLPFDNFSSSLYSVPMLLFFRLFYPAAPYSIKCALQELESGLTQNSMPGFHQTGNGLGSKMPASEFLGTYAKLDVCAFSERLNVYSELANTYRISAMTWVKALASPLSHEFLQIIIEHTNTGQRYRLVTERTDVGDTVMVGWDWSSHEYASHHHILPLPLLSVSFEDGAGPSLSQLSTILIDTSKVQSYNLLREMCWWYAEKVFTRVAQEKPGIRIKQWPYASLRYSFVVQNEWIKRQALVREAQKFRAMTRNQILY